MKNADTTIAQSLNCDAADTANLARANRYEIDLDALVYNVRAIRRMIGSGVSLFAALKANGYGFGALAVAETVVAAGADGLAVVDLRDAVGIREAGITAPIHLYGGMLITSDVARCVDALDLMPTILNLDDASVYSRFASKPMRVFVKVELGLERFGISPDETPAFVEKIQSMPNLRLHGLSTHFHVPRRPAEDVMPYLQRQFSRFEQTIRAVEALGMHIPIKMASSSASLCLSQSMNLNAVDPGNILFGLYPGGPQTQLLEIRPVMRSLKSTLVHIHLIRRTEYMDLAPFPIRAGMRVGVIPIGAVDGMPTLHCGEVLLNEHRCQVLSVSVEHTRIDVTDADATVGDEVVIIGCQGSESIEIVDVVAHQRLYVSASVPLAIQHTVPRVYVGGAIRRPTWHANVEHAKGSCTRSE